MRRRNARCRRPAEVKGHITFEQIASEPGRPHAARDRNCDDGPRQEVEETKLSGKVRGVGRLHIAYEASNKADDKSAAESVEGRRPVGGKASGDACSGLSAGVSMSLKRRAYVANVQGLLRPADWARPTFDKSPVRESRTPGSVGEALSNQRLYPTKSTAMKE